MEKLLQGNPDSAQLTQAAGAKGSHLMRLSHRKGQHACPVWLEPHFSSLERGGNSRVPPQGGHRTEGDSQCLGMWMPVWQLQH